MEEVRRTPAGPDKLARESFAEALQGVERVLEQPVIDAKMLKRLIDIAHARRIKGAQVLRQDGGHRDVKAASDEFDRVSALVRAKGFTHLLPYEVPGQGV